MRSAGAAQACCKQRERANSAESSQAERRWEAGICRGSYKRLTPYFIVMFPVFAVERAKTGFVLSPVTGLLCVKRAQNMRCKFRGKCVFFSFVFLRGFLCACGRGEMAKAPTRGAFAVYSPGAGVRNTGRIPF